MVKNNRQHPVPARNIGWLGILAATTFVFLVGPAGAQGMAGPAAITDLVATGGTESATLTFTAPKGTGGTGNAAAYDVVYSLVPITAANFSQATPANVAATPMAAGGKESIPITGLLPLENYYFAVESTDTSMNASAISNVVQASTAATEPPLPTAKMGQPGLSGYYYQFPTSLPTMGYLYPPNAATSPGPPDRAAAFLSTNIVNEQTDPQISVDMAANFGNGMLDTSHFGARWVGQLKVPQDGSWVIRGHSDDGMRIWLSENPIDPTTPDRNALIVDNWWDNSITNADWDSLPMTLSKSKTYNLMVEYYQNTSNASAHLQWTGPGTGMNDDVPTSALTSGAVVAAPHGRVNGTVVDSNGKPVAGADVAFTSGQSRYITTSDGAGAYTIYLLPGSYTVLGGAPAGWSYSHLPTSPVTVTAGQITPVPAITADIPPFYETTTTSPYDDAFTGARLDPKWTDVDLGNSMGAPATVASDMLQITAGGWDVNGNADGENFTYQTIKGDFAVSLVVNAIPHNQDWEMGGLDVRLTADAASAHGFFQAQMGHGMQHKIRPTNGAGSVEWDLDPTTTGENIFPVYLKIRRIDDTLAFFWTEDPVKGPVHRGFIEQVPAFKGATSLVAGAAGCAHDMAVTDPGFQYSHFKVESLASSTPSVVCGNLSGSGTIGVADATLALRIAVGLLQATPAQQTAACGHSINVAFATQVLRAAIGLGPAPTAM